MTKQQGTRLERTRTAPSREGRAPRHLPKKKLSRILNDLEVKRVMEVMERMRERQ